MSLHRYNPSTTTRYYWLMMRSAPQKQNDRKQFTFQMYHKSVCGSHFLFL